ncbi:uncharacterized protein LOC131649847 [Vicia villosa]|uniref:uncharacterized protein LOC131649847 n=1 Tax=Vicia villosa TaxID=3911 RepID=UPI00273B2700|nr:uncharacterized protein LOC131649847 [Vicia villosa]
MDETFDREGEGEIGVKKSWTKLIVIGMTPSLMHPIRAKKNEEITNNKLTWFDHLITHIFEKLEGKQHTSLVYYEKNYSPTAGMDLIVRRPPIINVYVRLVLWNPTTEEFKIIPPSLCVSRLIESSPHDDEWPEFYVHGFGYDQVNNDYKVVRCVQIPLTHYLHIFWEIYSLRNNCWSELKFKMPASYSDRQDLYVYTDGTCHWLSVRFKGEIGVKKSWTKLIVIGMTPSFMHPIRAEKNEEITNNKLTWFDHLITHIFEKLEGKQHTSLVYYEKNYSPTAGMDLIVRRPPIINVYVRRKRKAGA